MSYVRVARAFFLREAMSRHSGDEQVALENRQLCVQAASREIGNAIARQKKRERAQAQQWQVNGELKHVVLAICERSGGYAEPCVPYLEKEARRRHWPDKSIDDMLNILRALANSVDDDDRASAPALAVLRTAWNFVLQWRVAVWCLSMNVERGIAVSTAAIVDEFRTRMQEIVPEVMIVCFVDWLLLCFA